MSHYVRSFIQESLASLVLLLALFIGLGGSPAEAQAPKGSFAYVFLWGSGSLNEGWGSAQLNVSRLLVDMNHGVKHFKICFTGSASPGTDFTVVRRGVPYSEITLSSNCFTDTWPSGDWWDGAENVYDIRAVRDNVSDPNETITATVSADGNNHWGANYHLFGSYATAKFTIRGG